jgi:hypothetical protein
MANPMMQPSQWANGVQEPNYAQPLMDFTKMLAPLNRNMPQQMPQRPQGAQPMQITPGAGQGQPMRPQQQGGAMPAAMNAIATPWASALMKMFGGQGMQGGGFSPGNAGGTAGPMGGSGNSIY